MGTSITFMVLAVLAVVGAGLFIAFKVIQGVFWVLLKVFTGLGIVLRALFSLVRRILKHAGGFLRNMAVDSLHTTGAVVTAAAIVPLTLGNLLIGRWSSAKHYAKALEDEVASAGLGLYRIAIGHPFRLIGLSRLIRGLEKRLPEIIDRAPRRKVAKDEFPGYQVLGSLPTGGSGAQLYIARPLAETFQRFQNQRRAIADEVVIKSFVLEQGSTLPQIVRESRALEAAGKLGLVFEHQMTPERFYYVMPYVKGKELDREIHRLHARSSPEGLGTADLSLATSYAIDVLAALERFHNGGLWHKDVKPANLIVADGRVQLVDFGLVTPLASALTLTTHGTEYYRDPEMVRLAMQGVKVHEVDGVRFDIYSAGAVLFSMIENSFPAHGSLSKITKRCPEALRWIVHRAMADLRMRYGSAREMREDLQFVAQAADPFAVRPADLPSFTGQSMPDAELPPPVEPPVSVAGPASERYMHVAASDAIEPEPALEPGGRWNSGGWHRSNRRRRSRPARLATAAAVLFFGFLGMRLLFSNRMHRDQRPWAIQVAQPVPSRDFNAMMSLSAKEREIMDLGQIAIDTVEVEDPFNAVLERMVESWSEGDIAAAVAPASKIMALESLDAIEELLGKGNILILTELHSDIETTTLQERLTERGFHVLEDIELQARAHKLIGVSAFSDALTHHELRGFMKKEQRIAGIVLVEGTRDGERVCRTVVPLR